MTDEEKKEKRRQYYLKNKERFAQYYQNNKERIAEYKKQYQSENKERIAEYQKQYRSENKERLAEQNKQYYKENKERIAQYHQDNKERIAEYRKQYRSENKERLDEQRKQYFSTKKGRAVKITLNYIKDDNNRGFSTDQNIDASWIVDNIFSGQSCVYCGDNDWTHLGADRIDNTKPHTPDNVVCCCGLCNIEKNDNYTVEEFKRYRALHPRDLSCAPEKSWEIAELPNGTKVLKKKQVDHYASSA